MILYSYWLGTRKGARQNVRNITMNYELWKTMRIASETTYSNAKKLQIEREGIMQNKCNKVSASPVGHGMHHPFLANLVDLLWVERGKLNKEQMN